MVAFFATTVKAYVASIVIRSLPQSAVCATRLRLSQVVFSSGYASGSPLAEAANYALPSGLPS
jgi:hypothetical protein